MVHSDSGLLERYFGYRAGASVAKTARIVLLTAILAVQVSIDCLSYCRFEVSLVLVWCRQTPVEPASFLFDPCNALSDVCRLSHGQVVVSGVQQCSVVYEVAFVLVFVHVVLFC